MLTAALIAAVATGLVGGDVADPRVTAPAVVTSFRAVEAGSFGLVRYAWAAPERFAVRPARRRDSDIVERTGTRTVGAARGFPGSVTRRMYPARPDAFSEQARLPDASYILARSRGGKPTFTTVEVEGQPALRARYRVRRNACAGLRGGRVTFWLDQETLLPLRFDERRPGFRRSTTIAYMSVNEPVSAKLTRRPKVRPRRELVDQLFRRTSPEAAAAQLSYTPMLPTGLPAGFSLAVAGWAPRSGYTGAEASNPRYPELFAAVFRRGFEHIDLTQRLGGGGEWPGDPFGVECGFMLTSATRVHELPARFATGPENVPHLYWRDGPVLLTISGPFPKAELVAIAESLAPVAP